MGYWTGRAHAALGETDLARQSWNEVAALKAAPDRVGGALRENTAARGEQRYFQALAQKQLGTKQGTAAFHELIATGSDALKPSGGRAGPSPAAGDPQPARERMTTAHYLVGLGYAGLGKQAEARKEFTAALALSPDHLGAKIALGQLGKS
jgi:hypothetical protein